MTNDTSAPQAQAPYYFPSIATRLGWVSFFNDCSSEVIARAMPLLLTSGLGMTAVFVGMIEGIAETLSIIIKSISGQLSDHVVSRKPFVVSGYALSILSRFTLLALQIPMMVGLTRILDRSGKGLRTAPRDAMIADAAICRTTGHAFGITRALDTLGAVVGILAILLLGMGHYPMNLHLFRQIVWVSIPFGLSALLLVMIWIPPFPRQYQNKFSISFSIPSEIRAYLLIVMIFALANSSDAFLVLRAYQLGFSFFNILLIFLFFNLLAAILSIPIGKKSDKLGRILFLASGWLIYALVYFAIGNFTSSTLFIVFIILYGAFYGFTEGVEKALLADLLPENKRGAGYGALQMVLGLAALPASLMMGELLLHFGPQIAFSVDGTLALLSTLLLIFWSCTRTALDI